MKNILIVCYKYPPIYSGYGKQLNLILSDLKNKKAPFNFKVVTAFKESQKSNKNNNVISLLGNYRNKDNDIFLFSFKLFFYLLNNRKKISLIHCIKAGPEAAVCNFISKIFRIPLIIKIAQDELSVRELESGSKIKKYIRKLRQKFIGTSDYFIAISDEIEENIRANKLKKTVIHRIPNGVDTKRFMPIASSEKKQVRKKLNISADEFVVLFIGAINKRKGVPELLESAQTFVSNKKVRIVICGPLLDFNNFQAKVDKINKINDNVFIDYRGKIENPELFMQCADIFILPSHSEGLPNVLLEAASCGLPLITTNIGGSREIVIENQNGFIIPINSPLDISDKINTMILEDLKREKFGKRSRQHIENNYSLDFVGNKYIELYNFLSGKK